MRKLLCLVLLAVMSLSLVGCKTIQGAGKDIEKVGDKIEDAVD